MPSFEEFLNKERQEVAQRKREADADIERINQNCVTPQLQVPQISENLAWLPCLQPSTEPQ